MEGEHCIAGELQGESPMSPDLLTELEERRKYLENRSRFPLEGLTKYAGQWIAWRPDGSRIVAHAVDEAALEELILQAGEDPQRCIVEGIPTEDAIFGGGYAGPDAHEISIRSFADSVPRIPTRRRFGPIPSSACNPDHRPSWIPHSDGNLDQDPTILCSLLPGRPEWALT